MAFSWQEEVGMSLSDHYQKSKGRSPAQSRFLTYMNMHMQARNPGRVASPDEVEVLRLELEPLVIAEVRQSHPNFSPDRKELVPAPAGGPSYRRD